MMIVLEWPSLRSPTRAGSPPPPCPNNSSWLPGLFFAIKAYESMPLSSKQHHSLDLLPKTGTYVQIVAYKGGPEWDKGENRQAVVSAFAKVDLKKVAAGVAP